MFNNLIQETQHLGKPQWRGMLEYVARLHERSTCGARPPFSRPYEHIGTGYCYGPAFGHWDIIHQVLDSLPALPEHARDQILNNLENQEADGLVPGVIYLQSETGGWNTTSGHPPVWVFAVDDYHRQTGDTSLLEQCIDPLIRQIGWFEANRKADGPGFYYLDITLEQWESGIDEGIRFIQVPDGKEACVDATSHVYALYDFADRWLTALGRENPGEYRRKALDLRHFIQSELFVEETGFFFDRWWVDSPARRLAFEGLWPVVVGAATEEQANRVIDENLLNPERFYTEHPISTVGLSDPAFELRMWRGPAWNSMTMWAARGCMLYGRGDAARKLLEPAIDDSAAQFERTGTIFEFYHPHGGHPESLVRKPDREQRGPCRDYLGHNPLIAMARMWERAK